MPLRSGVAQQAERRAVNPRVAGSSPAPGAIGILSSLIQSSGKMTHRLLKVSTAPRDIKVIPSERLRFYLTLSEFLKVWHT